VLIEDVSNGDVLVYDLRNDGYIVMLPPDEHRNQVPCPGGSINHPFPPAGVTLRA
jgi:hypothetical protein